MATKRKQRVPALVKVALFCFALYAAVSLIHLQLQISSKTALLAELDAAIQSRTSENAALRESVQQGATDDQVAAVARDKLGYAYPQERVFVDASSK